MYLSSTQRVLKRQTIGRGVTVKHFFNCANHKTNISDSSKILCTNPHAVLYTRTSLSERPDINVVSWNFFFFFFAHKELYPLAKKYNNLCNMSDMTVWEKMAWQLPNKPYTVIISTQWFQITWKKKLLKIYATKSFTDHRSHSNPILYYICFSDPARKIQHKSVSLKTDGGYQYWPNEDPSNLYFEHNINDNNHWKTKVVFTSSCIDNILGDLHSSDIACH